MDEDLPLALLLVVHTWPAEMPPIHVGELADHLMADYQINEVRLAAALAVLQVDGLIGPEADLTLTEAGRLLAETCLVLAGRAVAS